LITFLTYLNQVPNYIYIVNPVKPTGHNFVIDVEARQAPAIIFRPNQMKLFVAGQVVLNVAKNLGQLFSVARIDVTGEAEGKMQFRNTNLTGSVTLKDLDGKLVFR